MIIFPFAGPPSNASELLHRYDISLVVLSFVIAASASILAMYLAESAKQFVLKRDQQLALAGGAVALGAAVWSMHFIGMLAFELCATVKYAQWPTILSILPALIASWVAMRWLFDMRKGSLHLLLGGTLSGAGIGIMHYSGMLAMQTAAAIGFELWGVLVSVLVAVVLATLALWFRHICDGFGQWRAWRHVIGGLVMGAAITTMHYVGMASARFIGIAEFSVPVFTVDRWYLSMLIALGAMALIGLMTAQNMLAKQRQLGRELQFKEHQMRVIFQNAIDAIVITDHAGIIQTVNRSFEGLFGFNAQYALGKHVSMLIPEWNDLSIPNKLRRQTDVTDQWVVECNARHADGHEIPLRSALVSIREHDQDLYVGFLMDMTMFHAQQKNLERMVTEDALTGLMNRRGLIKIMQQTVTLPAKDRPGIALLFIDLDGFKAVNDKYGHTSGDEVLIEVSRRVQRTLRQDEVVCRFGGDEFVIMLRYLRDLDAITKTVADKVKQAIAPPILLSNGIEVKVGCSIGVANALPGKLEDIDGLLEDADTAMYQAKKSGGQCVVYFGNMSLKSQAI